MFEYGYYVFDGTSSSDVAAKPTVICVDDDISDFWCGFSYTGGG